MDVGLLVHHTVPTNVCRATMEAVKCTCLLPLGHAKNTMGFADNPSDVTVQSLWDPESSHRYCFTT
eukprot:10872901-Alexandrium_andersonii.AAC.1